MELSDLTYYNNQLLTFDDRTGIVYEVDAERSQVPCLGFFLFFFFFFFLYSTILPSYNICSLIHIYFKLRQLQGIFLWMATVGIARASSANGQQSKTVRIIIIHI